MRIKKLNEESSKQLLQNIKEHFNDIKNHYIKHDFEFIPLTKSMKFIEMGSYEINDKFFTWDNQFNLKSDSTGIYDFENAKLIFEAFDGLTPSDANDERLWIRLTHDHCHKYMVDRWMKGKDRSEKNIIERYFFIGSGQQARVRNGIARLWWIAYLTVQKDEIDEDRKWRYTKTIFESQDFITSILERTMGTYSNVRFGILDYYLENREAFGTSKSKNIQKILRDLNNYGGVSLLPLMSKDQVIEICSRLLPIKDIQSQ